MPLRSLVLRSLALLGLSTWTGGFAFYGAAVIPVLHESLSSLEAGLITQEVTDYLNGIGVVAVLAWWATAWVERRDGPARIRAARALLLAVTTLILAGLIALHRVMDARIEAGAFRGFYPIHRAYLIASTVQWLVNLGLMSLSLVPPQSAEERTGSPPERADAPVGPGPP